MAGTTVATASIGAGETGGGGSSVGPAGGGADCAAETGGSATFADMPDEDVIFGRVQLGF